MKESPEAENAEKIPKVVVTSRGSRYTYLEDGRTQRFKTATGETYEPMDILLFVPPLSEIPERFKAMYPNIFTPNLTEEEFNQVILSFKDKLIVPMLAGGVEIKYESEVPLDEQVYLVFVNEKNERVLHIPVAHKPVVGHTTYDRKVWEEDNGERWQQTHFGHKVISIEY